MPLPIDEVLSGLAPRVPSRAQLTLGHFITFEGGEGAGKSTQIRYLAKSLRLAGIPVVETREPGGTPAAEAIRRLLLSGAISQLGPEAEAILFATARADHVNRLIAPSLAEGSWVLCDRFTDSARAYQGAAGIDDAMIEELERTAVGATMPELTMILDLPVEVGIARAGRRSTPDRFEQDTIAEHKRRREVFLDIAKREVERVPVVDASRDEEEVAAVVWEIVRDRFTDLDAGDHG